MDHGLEKNGYFFQPFHYAHGHIGPTCFPMMKKIKPKLGEKWHTKYYVQLWYGPYYRGCELLITNNWTMYRFYARKK